MTTVPPTVPASDPNMSFTYPQMPGTRESSENTLHERQSLKTLQDPNFDVEHHRKGYNDDNDAEKAQDGRLRRVDFWDPSLAKTREWALIHWVRTSLFNIAPRSPSSTDLT